MALLCAAARAAEPAETTYARGLTELRQPEVLEKLAHDHGNDPAGDLYQAQLILTRWDTLAKSRIVREKAERDYVRYLNAYLDAKPPNIDGLWALDHAKFIFARLATNAANRIEYWGTNPRERAALRPDADLALHLTDLAAARLQAVLDGAEKTGRFDDKAYMSAYSAHGEAEYYGAWARYFAGIAQPNDAPDRGALFRAAIATLGQWADGSATSGVKYQSLLLRGKAEAEVGLTAAALQDLAAAGAAADAPDWVQYQAHYQRVVAHLLAHDPTAARGELQPFRTWIDAQPQIAGTAALISADLLGYRVAAAEAATLTGAARAAAETQALAGLEATFAREPTYRDLIFEQLAAGLDGSADAAKLPPLPALALAWTRAQAGQGAAGADQKTSLSAAAQLAEQVLASAATTPAETREALLIAAVCRAQLGALLEAVRLNLRFVQQAPDDARARQVMNLTLAQLGALHKANTASDAVTALTDQALTLATNTLGMTQWLYARGTALEESGDLAAAAAAYAAVPGNESTYLDAQYRLLRVAVARLHTPAAATGPAAPPAATPEQRSREARELLARIRQYFTLVAHADPPAQTRLAPYLLDLRLVQATLELSPLEDPQAALEALSTLEREAAVGGVPLAPTLQTAILRCRVQAYEQAHQTDQALATLAKLPPQEAPAIILAMARQNIDEVTALESTSPDGARRRAAAAAQLLHQLVILTVDKDQAYAYRQLEADMLARAGATEPAQKLWTALQQERPPDLLNFLGEARAIFLAGDYPKAEDYFGRILAKVPIASESYWECYLRILQSADRQNKTSDVIRQRLRDLRASYGAQVGGQKYHAAYAELFAKYHVE
jgi:hypothetical protein